MTYGKSPVIFRPTQKPQHRVVVTGLGAVTPLGLNVEDSWRSALGGVSGIAPVTRFDASSLDVRIAGEVKNFNPVLYIEKKEQKKMDLFIQYGIAATHMALQMSGLSTVQIESANTGALIGVGMGGLPVIEEQMNKMFLKGPGRLSPFFIPSVIGNLAAGQISLFFKATGPNYSVTSACASGAHSIGEACQYIRNGTSKVMIAGGTEGVVCMSGIGGFAAMKALSTRNEDPTKASRPWDQDRDGFVLAEGSGILILESLEHALERGATILCEVTGYGASGDAYHMTTPSPMGAGAARAIQHCLTDAAIAYNQVDYVNAHGTSTPVGDLIETQALKSIFKEHASKLMISSTKSMMGHALGAAGAIESVFCILALRDQIAPPTINLENPSTECDLDYVPHQARPGKIQHVLNNSFGFGGTNACLLFSQWS